MEFITILLVTNALAFCVGSALAWDRGWRRGYQAGTQELRTLTESAYLRGGIEAVQIDRHRRRVGETPTLPSSRSPGASPPVPLRLDEEEEEG